MDTFFQEYGLVIVTIAAMSFFFFIFMILPTKYAGFETQLMSELTGVSVQDMTQAKQVTLPVQEYVNSPESGGRIPEELIRELERTPVYETYK